MARIFITGSAGGLGQLAARVLIYQEHQVVLHARDEDRAQDAREGAPGAEAVLTGDLSSMEETKELARKANDLGTFDAVIHNAGVYRESGEMIFAVNTLAPYILTCLMHRPERLIYLTSGMHLQGHANLENFTKDVSRISYSDSKLHVLMLSMAVANKWPTVYSNAVDPGWVPTKMGGRNAPDNLQRGYETQSWLAASDDENAKVTGRYFHHKKEMRCNPEALDPKLRLQFLARCSEVTGVSLDG